MLKTAFSIFNTFDENALTNDDMIKLTVPPQGRWLHLKINDT